VPVSVKIRIEVDRVVALFRKGCPQADSIDSAPEAPPPRDVAVFGTETRGNLDSGFLTKR
jgi:hypothetical protein